MTELFSVSRSGETTCTANGFLLHSQYNPISEAERFVQALEIAENPKNIVITGASLSYCAPFLQKRFPHTKLICIQYSKAFCQTDSLWHAVLYSNQTQNLSERLYDLIDEEDLHATFFISWKPSEKPYKDEYQKTWQHIKTFVLKCRSVITTRTFFNRRWVKNCLRFCLTVNEQAAISAGTKPILIAASGYSLKNSIPHIKELKNRFFLIAVSSAVFALLHNNIIPDLIITTDGGFWAKKHLQIIQNQIIAHKIPVAAAFESALPAKIMQNVPIIPLLYNDGVDAIFAKMCGFTPVIARRNGTVSGTAAEFALNLTQNVFFCGLDLAPNPTGFAHTQPNALEKMHALHDFRLSPLENRHIDLGNESLDIYASWFTSRNADFNTRVFRIQNTEKPYARSLTPIKDITWLEAKKYVVKNAQKNVISVQKLPTIFERKNKLHDYFVHIKNNFTGHSSKNYQKLFFGMPPIPEKTLWQKTIDLSLFLQKQNQQEKEKKLEKECESFFEKLIGIINVYGK